MHNPITLIITLILYIQCCVNLLSQHFLQTCANFEKYMI